MERLTSLSCTRKEFLPCVFKPKLTSMLFGHHDFPFANGIIDG